jgi:hypothetical protein
MKKGIKSGEGVGKGQSEAEREVQGGGWIGAERGERGQRRVRRVGGGWVCADIQRLGGIFSFFSYNSQHCFICRPSDSTVLTGAGIEPRTVATGALAVRRSNR